MFIIDIVMIASIQKFLVNKEIAKGNMYLTYIGNLISSTSKESYYNQFDNFILTIIQTYRSNDFSCMIILSSATYPLYSFNDSCQDTNDIENFTKTAIDSKKNQINYIGSTWGVFWKSYRYVILSTPVIVNDDVVVGVGIAITLDPIYIKLRYIQFFILLYIVLNCVLLTFVGVKQLTKITIKPLSNLIKKTELYHDDDQFNLLDEKNGHEFSQLSKTISKMLHRISDDKLSLKQSIQSLEKANEDLKNAQHEVIRSEKMASVGRLASGIAHEIGNPISIVLGYLDLLKRNDISSEERQEFIVRVESEILRIHSIIKQLLDFSRPSKEERTFVSVHNIINEVVDIIKLHPKFSSITFILHLFSNNDIIFADSNYLRQVFVNLLINSADAIESKYSHSDGIIRIETEVINSCIIIKVIDNGIGIPKNDINSIFDPFYTTKAPGKGTGLGLSVSLKLIESFSGTIQVESEENIGTTISISFPLSQTGTNNGRT